MSKEGTETKDNNNVSKGDYWTNLVPKKENQDFIRILDEAEAKTPAISER